jgi:hypothetical protein
VSEAELVDLARWEGSMITEHALSAIAALRAVEEFRVLDATAADWPQPWPRALCEALVTAWSRVEVTRDALAAWEAFPAGTWLA